MSKLEQTVQAYAKIAHCGHYRKDGKTPYIKHIEAVVAILKKIEITDEDILCAAWLHDTIEDCGVSKSTIEEAFNPNIARIVAALTRDTGREEYRQRLQDSDYAVKIIKLADYLHNCSDLTSDLPDKTIRNKVEEYPFYTGLAEQVNPSFCHLISYYLEPYIRAQSFMVLE